MEPARKGPLKRGVVGSYRYFETEHLLPETEVVATVHQKRRGSVTTFPFSTVFAAQPPRGCLAVLGRKRPGTPESQNVGSFAVERHDSEKLGIRTPWKRKISVDFGVTRLCREQPPVTFAPNWTSIPLGTSPTSLAPTRISVHVSEIHP